MSAESDTDDFLKLRFCICFVVSTVFCGERGIFSL